MKTVCDFDQCARVHTHQCPYMSCNAEWSCSDDWCGDMRNYTKLCGRCEPMINALSAWLGQYSIGELLNLWKRYTGETQGALPIRRRCAPVERHRQLVHSFIYEFPTEQLLLREIQADKPNALGLKAIEAIERWCAK